MRHVRLTWSVIYEGRAEVKARRASIKQTMPRHQRRQAPVIYSSVSHGGHAAEAAQSNSDRPLREVMTDHERAWVSRARGASACPHGEGLAARIVA